MTENEIKMVLEKHQKWLNDESGGERANLSVANLRGADLRDANLRDANLRAANLRDADLSCADLGDADLHAMKSNYATTGFYMSCPEKGSFIGFKKAFDYIVELKITENAKRSSATSRKCRCSEAEVISITELDGSESPRQSVASRYDPQFIYRIGETVSVDNFDPNRWNECSTGIHFFLTREEAVKYE